MRRTRLGKRLALTRRDMAIFQALDRYRYLRSTYLHAFAGGSSVTRFKERLGDLFHEGHLERPEAQWQLADSRYQPVVYELGRGAQEILNVQDPADTARATYLGPGAHRQFLHSLMICEVLASIELACLSNPGPRFIAWDEILARAPESIRRAAFPPRIPLGTGAGECIVPDGIFGLEYQSNGKPSYRFFALEVDRGTMPITRGDRRQTSYSAKLAQYGEVIARDVHKLHLGIPNLLVLTVTTNRRRMADMLEKFGAKDEGAVFLFKAVDARRLTAPMVELLVDPWDRSGGEPLLIGCPG
jgi:hypothetical protein